MIFFFKQKTAYEMRISDWSSDVCSSDLGFVKNLSGGPRFSDVHQNSFRASLLVEPFDGFSNTTIIDYFKAEEQPAGITLLGVRPTALGPLAPLYGTGLLAALKRQRQVGPSSVFSGLDDPHLDCTTWGIVNTPE